MMDIITKMLFDNRDLKYKKFNSKIINNIDSDKIIGVRVPVIRKIAKEIKNLEYIDNFLEELPHKYLEEDIYENVYEDFESSYEYIYEEDIEQDLETEDYFEEYGNTIKEPDAPEGTWDDIWDTIEE